MLLAALAPWRDRDRLGRSLSHVMLSPLLGAVAFVFVVVCLAVTLGLVITFLLALPVIWLMFVGSHQAARIERGRLAALLEIDLADPVPPTTAPTWFGRVGEMARSGPRWREFGYLALLLPLGVVTGGATALAWCWSAMAVGMPFYAPALPGRTAKIGYLEVSPLASVGLALAGVVGLVVIAPWATLLLARLEGAVGRRLLGPDPALEVDARVSRLETSRLAAVEGAEHERRRIERDLHDGAQQRLVALAVGLGDARRRMDDDPETARRMVADAHEEAKAALAELRDLVRGIHPVVLHDRGLDAALSAVVARSPVPVDLDVQIAERLPPAVESAAYFIVSEALANVAVHSRARRAAVALARAGERLVVEVRDDGAGGADPARGSGLAGLRARAEALGGVAYVISPPGGPTTILAEIPCGS